MRTRSSSMAAGCGWRWEPPAASTSFCTIRRTASCNFSIRRGRPSSRCRSPARAARRSRPRPTQKVMARKDLSAAQKEMILKNMKAHSERHGLFGGPAVPAQYNKVASGVKVNGYTADEYEVILSGTKMREVWLADPKSLGIDPADAVAFKSMAERMGATSASSAGPGGRQSEPRSGGRSAPGRAGALRQLRRRQEVDRHGPLRGQPRKLRRQCLRRAGGLQGVDPGAPPAPPAPPAH